MREDFFDTRSIHFRQFRATLIFMAEKPPPPGWGKIWHRSIHFRWFEHLWFLWQKSPLPPPPRMREIFLTPDLSISGNFEQLWFLWQKSPPPGKCMFMYEDYYAIRKTLAGYGKRFIKILAIYLFSYTCISCLYG